MEAVIIIFLGLICLFLAFLAAKEERRERKREENKWKVQEDALRTQVKALQDIAECQRQMLRRG